MCCLSDGDAWWDPFFSSVSRLSIVGCGIIIFWAVAGNTAPPLDSTQVQKQRNMRRGAWVKSPDYYYFAGVFLFFPTNQSASCVPLRTAVQICQLHIAAGVPTFSKNQSSGHYIGENVSSNQQPLISLLSLFVSLVDEGGHDMVYST